MVNTRKIGEKILALRRARGWSLEILAAKTGVSVSQLSKIERGADTTTQTLRTIGTTFGQGDDGQDGGIAEEEKKRDLAARVLALHREIQAAADKAEAREARAIWRALMDPDLPSLAEAVGG